jgi:hypothetical protein
MKVDRLYPKICKQGSCLTRADYEFTDIQDGETITLAYACSEHVEDVRGLLEDIYKLKLEVKSAAMTSKN